MLISDNEIYKVVGMCGISGYYCNKSLGKHVLVKMNNTMIHRGPDDCGEEEVLLADGEWYAGLAHRRLSIIDLSMAGHQPMFSFDKKLAIVFNGEIYNFKEIKEELCDYPFSSKSDTEVIMASYLKWGVKCLEKINGMFAFAILDKRTDELLLARDRMGKKPLFYWIKRNQIVFASELKGIYAFPGFNENIRYDVLGDYFMHRSIHAPNTIYENVFCLEPGSFIRYKRGKYIKEKYWSIESAYRNNANTFKGSFEEALDELDRTIHKVVKQRLIADVEVGAFLSGGFDSSLICAIANEHLSASVKSFCIGFEDESINEAKYAREIANYLGCDYEERYISDDEMFSLVEDIPDYYDQPLADPAEIPLMLLSEMTRKKVKVALAGDGGDELFGGYGIYNKLILAQEKQKIGRIIYYLNKIPGIDRINIINNLPIEYRMVSCEPNSNTETQMGVDSYTKILDKILINPGGYYYQVENQYDVNSFAQKRMLLDLDTSLPDYMLVKTDRATMRSSLECRCPFMDMELIKFAFSLPLDYRIDRLCGKKILKELAYKYIPQQLLDRPKSGFVVPLDRWLRGPLKEKILDWSSYTYLKRQGIFKPSETMDFILEYMKNGDQKKWSGKNYSKLVWPYFVFQQWYDKYVCR